MSCDKLFPFLIPLIICIIGISYIVTGNAFDGQFLGTLVRVESYPKTECYCDSEYEILEFFARPNSDKTCTVRRLNTYLYFSQANNIVNSAVLGTQRMIYVPYNNHRSCFDITISRYYNTIGWIVLSIGILICCIFLYWYMLIRNKKPDEPFDKQYLVIIENLNPINSNPEIERV